MVIVPAEFFSAGTTS